MTIPPMSQHDFDELLQKYLAGACTAAEEKLILDWYQDITAEGPAVDGQKKAVIRQRIWQKLAANTTRKLPRHRLAAPFWFAGAASVLLLLTAGLWRSVATREPLAAGQQAEAARGSIEQTNTRQKPRLIRLEDGSVVTLQPGGVLNYPEHFGRQNRTVFLRGEAFFSVKRNPARPFIVHTGNLITEVLGTSFRVKADAGDKAVEVSVVTGRVSVYQATDGADRRNREVILKPNERITYSPWRKHLIPALVEQPVRVMPLSQPVSLVFDGVPLPKVLTRLQQVYGIDIVLESDGLATCVLHADLGELALFDQLELLCRSVGAQYDVRGTSIFITGTGCGQPAVN